MYNIIAIIIGEGNGNSLQCSCLENPRDGGAWWAAVYGISQSRTRLKRLSSSSSKNHFFNLFFNWRITALQDGAGFCHTATGTSPSGTHVPSLSSPPTPPRPHRARGWALVHISCALTTRWLWVGDSRYTFPERLTC